MPLTPEGALARVLDALDADKVPGPVAVAVSGGGDSTALLHAAVAVGRRRVVAATVDHGLREGSAAEAAAVAAACARLGVPHATLRWDGAGRGNLQARARDARRRLLGAWASEKGTATILLGHTADDQAETVLLRLARGSGVDGLAGMPAFFLDGGRTWERPFLGVTREALRAWLRARGIPWVDDPSNDDPRSDRARARAMMATLAGLGLTRERLVRTAGHMERARVTLAQEARRLAGEVVREEGRDLLLPRRLLRGVEDGDAAARVLAAALCWVGGDERRPRWESLRRLGAMAGGGRAATLHGCLVTPEDGPRGVWVRVAPEARNAAAPRRDPRLPFAGNARFL